MSKPQDLGTIHHLPTLPIQRLLPTYLVTYPNQPPALGTREISVVVLQAPVSPSPAVRPKSFACSIFLGLVTRSVLSEGQQFYIKITPSSSFVLPPFIFRLDLFSWFEIEP